MPVCVFQIVKQLNFAELYFVLNQVVFYIYFQQVLLLFEDLFDTTKFQKHERETLCVYHL